MKEQIKSMPVVGLAARSVARKVRTLRFPGSADYWERRYATGGDSGAGSYGWSAQHKAQVLNGFVREHDIQSVIEWGCGDGHQLTLAEYPSYIGLDVSDTAVETCCSMFAGDETKSFYGIRVMCDHARIFHADLALSLDVTYHLIEEEVFDTYLRRLFGSADRFVAIYATDEDHGRIGAHEMRRAFTPWINQNAPEWHLLKHVARPEKTNVFESDFYIFERR